MGNNSDIDEEKITYRKLEKSHISELTLIMKSAFDADTKMHTDLEEDGPSGYNNGKLLYKLMDLEHSESKVIYINESMIGGYTIVKDKDIYTLEMLFISPLYVSKGIGSMVWRDIEHMYSNAKTWIVETPGYSTRNHHFYEKCGFKKLKENLFENGNKSFVFIKNT